MATFANVGIFAISACLFAYWFRYTCVLLLAARSPVDYGSRVASDAGLQYPNVLENKIESSDAVARLLGRDCAILHKLLRNAGVASFDQSFLGIYYLAMLGWTGVLRMIAPAHRRHTHTEMARVLEYFANAVGEAAA